MNLFKSTDNHRNVNRNKKSAGGFFFHILGGKDLFFKQMKIYRLGELEEGADSSHIAWQEDGWLEKHSVLILAPKNVCAS